MLEHGAYTLLLDRYYSTEQGIPADQAHRVARAKTKEERAAVDAVLAEFFTLADGVWTKGRVQQEIAKAAGRIAAAQNNGKRGGRPKKEPEQNQETTQQKPGGFSLGSENGTQTKALHTPYTRHQEEKNPSGSSPGATRTPSIPCPYQAIVDLYHERLPMLPRVKLMTEARQRAMRKTWGWVLSSTKSDGERRATNADEALAWLAGFFARAAENDWLTGRTPRTGSHANWQCDLDFLLTERGMKHVIEKTREAA